MGTAIIVGIILIQIHLLFLFLKSKIKNVMATIEELSASVDALQVSIDAKQEQISNAIVAFEATIKDLQDQLANGISSAGLQTIVDKVVAAKADIESTPTA